jgi:4-hydroxy-2-oxoheptanedioate aldolase
MRLDGGFQRMITLKKRIRSRENLLGCFMTMPSPALVEVAGYAGFDFVVLDTEHGVSGTETLEHMMRAAAACGMPALVRTVGDSAGETLRALDAGAAGVLIPHVVSGEQATRIAKGIYYPPLGIRGFSGATRAGHHGFIPMLEHVRRANDEAVIIAQVEDAEALPDAAAIAAAEGLDGIFVGPGDLSISLGYPGELNHPEVLNAGRQVAEHCRAAGIGAATFARDADEVSVTRANGFSISIMSSVTLISSAFRSAAAAVRSLPKQV